METQAKVDKHINCIIEDYKAIKNEISRRSELQRFALLAYGGVIILSLKFNEEPNFYPFQILLIWSSSVIAHLFYISEDIFIKRLSKIAFFNGWLFSQLLDIDKNDNQFNDKPLKLQEFIKDRLEKNGGKESIKFKDVVFPSESPAISRIINVEKQNKTNNKIYDNKPFYNWFLACYLTILPLIITVYYYLSSYDKSSYTIYIWAFLIICLLIVNISLYMYSKAK